jgi:hypothetical protein
MDRVALFEKRVRATASSGIGHSIWFMLAAAIMMLLLNGDRVVNGRHRNNVRQ